MKLVTFDDIKGLSITPAQCLEWVSYSIQHKAEATLPAKISLKPREGSFMNTMPCFITTPDGHAWGGVKLVTRFPEKRPALDSKLILLDIASGEMVALMDADWITAMRTGAVAAHSIELLAKKGYTTVALMGLGNTARATMIMLAEYVRGRSITVRLLRYKDQAERFMERFAGLENVSFEVVDDVDSLIRGAEVVVSCATYFEDDVCADDAFDEGVLVVPVHTRGFTNCDLFFDKVFADDYGHVHHFKNFDRFRSFAEVSDVVCGRAAGRESAAERILAYNIGLSIHDIAYAARIWGMLDHDALQDIDMAQPREKFWV